MSAPFSRHTGTGLRVLLALGLAAFLVLAGAGAGLLAVDRPGYLPARIGAAEQVLRGDGPAPFHAVGTEEKHATPSSPTLRAVVSRFTS